MARSLAILIVIVLAAQSALGGLHGSVLLCLGGSGELASVVGDGAQETCDHEHGVPFPTPSHEHDGACCDDVRFTVVELIALPGSEDGPSLPLAQVAHAVLQWPMGASTGVRGPPAPPWLDHAATQRLSIVSSIRLTL
jgi:hypothetical protein